jgi:hypothetical protein
MREWVSEWVNEREREWGMIFLLQVSNCSDISRRLRRDNMKETTSLLWRLGNIPYAITEWVSDGCFTLSEQFVSSIMTRTWYFFYRLIVDWLKSDDKWWSRHAMLLWYIGQDTGKTRLYSHFLMLSEKTNGSSQTGERIHDFPYLIKPAKNT